MPIGLLIYVFYLYDQYWPNEVYLKEYEKIKEMKEHLGNRIVDGVPEPDMPDFYNNNTTLYGVDKNKNGVRDDVEIWINLNARSKLEKEMYINYARSVFYYTDITIKDMSKSDLLNDINLKHEKLNKNYSCLQFVCEALTKKLNVKVNCLDKVSDFDLVIRNNKVRLFNLSDLDSGFDFGVVGGNFNRCKQEINRRLENVN